jgi:hypothetical protein
MSVLINGRKLGARSRIFFDGAHISNSKFQVHGMAIEAEAALLIRKAEVIDTRFEFDAGDIVAFMSDQGRPGISGGLSFPRHASRTSASKWTALG